MPARGMAADHQRLAQPRQFARRHPHLKDDLIDGDIGAKVVAWNGDTDAVSIQPAGQMAEERTVQRLPISAMDKNDDRAITIAGKKINRVARTGTVRHRTRGVLRAVACGIPRPT